MKKQWIFHRHGSHRNECPALVTPHILRIQLGPAHRPLNLKTGRGLTRATTADRIKTASGPHKITAIYPSRRCPEEDCDTRAVSSPEDVLCQTPSRRCPEVERCQTPSRLCPEVERNDDVYVTGRIPVRTVPRIPPYNEHWRNANASKWRRLAKSCNETQKLSCLLIYSNLVHEFDGLKKCGL
ncbi:hypothetical protein DPMN_012483 [Dreissena polymorpha]|uniref:Uncharacterized protein n=1 Tax=Dreissena polymorpha TaxID=45954 RepID=A0A9D4S2V4_DREPO|nr:hypothetical protein DPMN_012483 [Dreissena polymorpha]